MMMMIMTVVVALGVFAATASAQSDPCEFESPPFVCPFTCTSPNPVCGANGVTYRCGCPDAACAAVRVVRLGPC
ncbi:unnamed protein product [Linum tenue]|uniref:Kazal-like domain-containing protein n=1 Tax=Linum tenue TaxID=586396 RepID=A0AAV0PIV0_9ROSI|nr:unnamed protein product [Linum tenue]